MLILTLAEMQNQVANRVTLVGRGGPERKG